MKIVYDEVFDARTQWKNIGLHLDVTYQALNVIEWQHSHSIDDRFREVLTKWLTGNGEKTWSKLAEALKNKTVGLTYLSDQIIEKYCN